MWFADVGQVIAGYVAAAWMSVATIALARRRTALGAVLAPVARFPVLVGMTIATALLVAQAVVVDMVEDVGGAGPLDVHVWTWFVDHRSPQVTFVMKAVSQLGDSPETALLAIVGAALLLWARRGAEAAVVLGAAAGSSLLVNDFKALYNRPRPPVGERLAIENNPSLPSGHALGSTVVIGVLAAVVVLLVRHVAVRVLAIAAAAVTVATIGVSRLYLGVHWATDVLTGWFLGGTWLALCVTFLCVVRAPNGRAQTRASVQTSVRSRSTTAPTTSSTPIVKPSRALRSETVSVAAPIPSTGTTRPA
jgi:membrane-associated phospholipid phosphatase